MYFYLSFPSVLNTLQLASSVAQATLRLFQQASCLLGRITKVSALCILALSSAFCAKLTAPIAILGFAAHWILPQEIEQMYSSLVKAFLHSYTNGFIITCLGFLLLPATILLASFTVGIAIKIFWSSNQEHLNRLLVHFFSLL